MARTYTLPGFAEQLKKLSKDLGKAVLPPMRKHQKAIRGRLIAAYWDVPFGERIWEWRRRKFSVQGGPAVKLGTGRRPKNARWSRSEEAFIAPITVSGMAAKMEEGGRLRRHVLWGRQSDIRAGLPVPRKAVMDRIIDDGWDRAVKEISKSYRQFVDRNF
jgi:hypothetical protein